MLGFRVAWKIVACSILWTFSAQASAPPQSAPAATEAQASPKPATAKPAKTRAAPPPGKANASHLANGLGDPFPKSTFTPRPNFSLLPKSVNRVELKKTDPTPPQPVVVGAPRQKGKPPATTFHLSQEGKVLTLSFVANDPNFDLNLRKPLSIHMDSDEHLELEPSIISHVDWPKQGNSLTIKMKGAAAGQNNVVLGKAHYTICHKTTHNCLKAGARFGIDVQP